MPKPVSSTFERGHDGLRSIASDASSCHLNRYLPSHCAMRGHSSDKVRRPMKSAR